MDGDNLICLTQLSKENEILVEAKYEHAGGLQTCMKLLLLIFNKCIGKIGTDQKTNGYSKMLITI